MRSPESSDDRGAIGPSSAGPHAIRKTKDLLNTFSHQALCAGRQLAERPATTEECRGETAAFFENGNRRGSLIVGRDTESLLFFQNCTILTETGMFRCARTAGGIGF